MTVSALSSHRFASDRGHLRRERQARVGILRNTNAPPKPPTRRAALTGKWPSLRSSRRAAPGLIDQLVARMVPDPLHPPARSRAPEPVPPPSAPATDSPAVLTDDVGTVTGIDLGGLMRAVENMAPAVAKRAPFAAEYRGVVDQAGPLPEEQAKPSNMRPAPRHEAATPRAASADSVTPPGPRVRARPGRARKLRRLLIRVALFAALLAAALFMAVLFLQLLSPLAL